jgi:hypothetical protein
MNDDPAKADVLRQWIVCLAAPAVWALHLFVMYAAHALLCARSAAGAGDMLWPLLAISTGVVALGALVAMPGLAGWDHRAALSRARAPGAADGNGFSQGISLGLVVLALLGVLWTMLTTALISPCAR